MDDITRLAVLTKKLKDAGHPIVGVNLNIDKETKERTLEAHFTEDATNEQKSAANSFITNFDWDNVAEPPKPPNNDTIRDALYDVIKEIEKSGGTVSSNMQKFVDAMDSISQ